MTFIASPKSMLHFWCWCPWQPIPVLNRNQSAGSSFSKFVSWFNTQFWGYLPYVPYQNIISNHISYTIYIRIMYSVSLSIYIYIYIIIAEFPHQLPSVFSCFTLPSPSVRASHVAGGRCEIWRCVTKARLKMSAGPGGQLWGDHTGDASHGVSTR